MASPVVTRVSHATRLTGSCVRMASRIESEIWSAILSGCPSVTDSDVKRCRPLRLMPCAPFVRLEPDSTCKTLCFRWKRLSLADSGARVKAIVDRAEPCFEDVGVDLRRRQVRVPEHQLDRAQVRAALEQMRRERVAQHVRTHGARQPCRPRMLLQDLPEPDPAE